MAVDNVYTRTVFAHWAVVYTLIMKNKPAKLASGQVFFVIKSVITENKHRLILKSIQRMAGLGWEKICQTYVRAGSENDPTIFQACKGRVRI